MSPNAKMQQMQQDAANAFQKRLDIRIYPKDMSVSVRRTMGELRALLGVVCNALPVLRPYVCLILQEMAQATYMYFVQHGNKEDWKHRWKRLSHLGYDVIKNRLVDYGNKEYGAVVQALALLDDDFKVLLEYLVKYYWPSLDAFDPEHLTSENGIEKKGDLIEIFLAVLRGDRQYLFGAKLQRQLISDGLTLPVVFQHLCDLCRLTQYLDSCLCSGFVKASKRHITKLATCKHFEGDAFVQLWCFPNKGYCLAALLRAHQCCLRRPAHHIIQMAPAPPRQIANPPSVDHGGQLQTAGGVLAFPRVRVMAAYNAMECSETGGREVGYLQVLPGDEVIVLSGEEAGHANNRAQSYCFGCRCSVDGSPSDVAGWFPSYCIDRQ